MRKFEPWPVTEARARLRQNLRGPPGNVLKDFWSRFGEAEKVVSSIGNRSQDNRMAMELSIGFFYMRHRERRRIDSKEHDPLIGLSQFQVGIPQTLAQVLAHLWPDGEMVREMMLSGKAPVLLVTRVGQKEKQVRRKERQSIDDVEQEGLVKLQGWPVTNRGRKPGLHLAQSRKSSKKGQSFTQSELPGSRK